jgi:hypothetical protein
MIRHLSSLYPTPPFCQALQYYLVEYLDMGSALGDLGIHTISFGVAKRKK